MTSVRVVSVASVFAALAVLLSQSAFRIPAPYAPFLKYGVWEVPIVTAFLLFGVKAGLFALVVNYLVLQLTPGGLPSGPIFNLVAIAAMLLGVYLSYKPILSGLKIRSQRAAIVLSIGLGVLLRVVVMSVMNFFLLPLPFPLGFSIPAAALSGLLILIAIFNATTVLYTVPLSYALARIVSTRTANRETWVSRQIKLVTS